jgi:hypothetical protein
MSIPATRGLPALNDKTEKAVVRPSDEAIERQSEYDPVTKTFIARCGVCGKTQTLKKPLFCIRSAAIGKVRLMFNFCDTCNKWVCEDCFLTDDGNGSDMGLFTVCAQERGKTGLTSSPFELAWPRLPVKNTGGEKGDGKRGMNKVRRTLYGNF